MFYYPQDFSMNQVCQGDSSTHNSKHWQTLIYQWIVSRVSLSFCAYGTHMWKASIKILTDKCQIHIPSKLSGLSFHQRSRWLGPRTVMFFSIYQPTQKENKMCGTSTTFEDPKKIHDRFPQLPQAESLGSLSEQRESWPDLESKVGRYETGRVGRREGERERKKKCRVPNADRRCTWDLANRKTDLSRVQCAQDKKPSGPLLGLIKFLVNTIKFISAKSSPNLPGRKQLKPRELRPNKV